MGTYVVLEGDSLWNIAKLQNTYDDPWKWGLFYEANRGQIKDPEKIKPGSRLRYPLNPAARQIQRAFVFALAYEPAPRAQPVAAEVPEAPQAASREGSVVPGPIWTAVVAAWVLIMGFYALILLLVPLEKFSELGREPAKEGPRPVPTESEEIIRAMNGPAGEEHEEEDEERRLEEAA